MRSNFIKTLISLADQLDREGKFDKADQIDENFEEFLALLESGEFEFDNIFVNGPRDPRLQRGNLGPELTLSGMPGPQ